MVFARPSTTLILHVYCTMHDAALAFLPNEQPKLQLHVHSLGFQTRVSYPPIGSRYKMVLSAAKLHILILVYWLVRHR